MKPPLFDGKTSWSTYLKQFEAAANANNWSLREKATSLTLSLRGDAAEILQKLSPTEQDDYTALVKHLEMRYGHEHLKHLHRSQLKARCQKSNESITEFEFDVSRLTRLAWPDVDEQTLEQLTVDAFLAGLQDKDIKEQVTLLCPRKIADALARALEIEAVKTTCKTLGRIRQVYEDDSEELVRRVVQELSSRKRREIRCWECGELGHVQSRCRKYNGKPSKSATSEN